MSNIRLISAAVKPAKRHEHTDKQTDKQTDSIFIYIDILVLSRVTSQTRRLVTQLDFFYDSSRLELDGV